MSKLVSQTMVARAELLSAEIVARQVEIQPDLSERFSAAEREHLLAATRQMLANLAQALDLDCPALFSDYISWYKVYLESREIPVRDLRINLHCVQQVLTLHFGQEEGRVLSEYLDAARAELEKTMPYLYTTELRGEYAGLAHEYLTAVLSSDPERAVSLLARALDNHTVSRTELYLRVLEPVQHEIGRLWQFNQLDRARARDAACVAGLALERLAGNLAPAPAGPVMLITSVPEEQHRLAPQMLADLFTAAGWQVVCPDSHLPAAGLVELLLTRNIQVLALSVTMAVHIRPVEKLIAQIRASDAAGVLILVGGAPFNLAPFLWRRIGADGCAADAEGALRQAQGLLVRG